MQQDFQQTGAGWWIRLIALIAFTAIIIAYAVQTFQLVQWLFSDGNIFMQAVTVFVCDGCATGYALGEMFYRFKLRRSKNLVFGMWIITFILSTSATVIQMYLSSTHTVPHVIDPAVITSAYSLIIAAFVINIIAITVIIRMEHGAGMSRQIYLDDKKDLPVMAVKQAVQSLPQTAQTGAMSEQELHKMFMAWTAQQQQNQPALPVAQPVAQPVKVEVTEEKK